MENKIEVMIHDAVFTSPSRCIQCGKFFDAATGVQSRIPKEGDVSICGYCGKLMFFTSDKKLRPATDGEMEEFKKEAPNKYLLAELISHTFKAKRAAREN